MILLIACILLQCLWCTTLQSQVTSRAQPNAQARGINENHSPSPPAQPEGPITGDVGQDYTYWTVAVDPEEDMVYYCFNWGDSTESVWVGPVTSGENFSLSHTWHQRGEHTITVKAKDTFGAESNWSDGLSVLLEGPHLTFTAINGGNGLSFEIKNIGEQMAEAIEIDVATSGGLFVFASPTHYQIPSLASGASLEQHVRVWGAGLGILSDLPTISLVAQAPDAKTRSKQVTIRLIGPFVKKVGEAWCDDESSNGYTLFTPMMSTKTFLINNSGGVVHIWNSTYKPALSVYLLENGDLLRTAFSKYSPRFWGGGIGGGVELFDWNGSRRWYFEYTTDQHCLHHDVKMLPNGNILMIAWEYKSKDEAIAKGRNPNTIPPGELWLDHLIEVQPSNGSGGTIVWEWHLWNHLIQDFDPTKENYGVVQNHPELVDINYGGRIIPDWTHINSVDYNPDYDQILLSVLSFDEIWVIDHSTTTEEAAGHSGGRYGKGGDLLYRWGNPQTYRLGNDTDQKLFNQHDAVWIAPGLPGAGNILVFNNGMDRPDGQYSSVEEIVPPVEENGSYYRLAGSAFGPAKSVWEYIADPPADFFAINLGGAQRLPNGNTLICNGPQGVLFEITPEKEIVWQYDNQVPTPLESHVFKVIRYSPEYPGLKFL